MSEPERARRLRVGPRTCAALVFAAAAVVLAWPTLRGRSISIVPTFQTATYPWAADPRGLAFAWPQSDAAESSFPWSALAQRTWRDGALPLWDPHSFGGGTPLAADGVSATLYPVRALIDASLPLWLAHDLFVLLHVLAAGLATYWLARRWGCGRAAATFGGVAWMTSAYLWGWAQLEMVTPFFALLPLALAACDRAVRDPGRRSFVVAAVVLGLTLVAGNIAYAVVTLACAAFYVVALLVRRAFAQDRRAVGLDVARAGLLLALGLALSAFAFVPNLVNLARISRQPYPWEFVRDSLLVPWSQYAEVITPPATPPTATDLAVLFYVTPVVLALAVVGLVLPPSRWAAAGRLLMLVVPVLVASWAPAAWLAYHLLPGFDAVQSNRLPLISLLAVHLIAATGLDQVLRRLRRGRGRVAVPTALTAGLLLTVFWPSMVVARSLNPPDLDVDEHPPFPTTPALTAMLGLDTGPGWPARIVPTVPSLSSDPPMSGALALVGGTPLAPGIDAWGGYSSSSPTRTSQLVRLVAGEPQDVVLGPDTPPALTYPRFLSGDTDWALACAAGADAAYLPPETPDVPEDWGTLDPSLLSEVYTGADGRVLTLPDGCASEPYVTTGTTRAESDTDAVDRLRRQGRTLLADDAAQRRAVLSPGAPRLGLDTDAVAGGQVSSARRDGLDAVVDVSVSGSSLLVLPISHDPGWRAEVDGEALETYRVDVNRLAVVVPEGDHEVRVSYRPQAWRPALALTGLGILTAAMVLVPVPWRRLATRRRAGEHGSEL